MSASSLPAPVSALRPHWLQCHSVWRSGCFPYIGRRAMSSMDTAGSQGSESEISATVVSLRERFEAIRQSEIQRVRGRLRSLSPDQENTIDSLSHDLIERLLQAPMAMLKNASAGKHAL